MMYQRPGRTREAPLPIVSPWRMQSQHSFRSNVWLPPYAGPCNLDCIQGIRLVREGGDTRHAILAYCCVHDQVGDANETLRGVFIAGHQSQELYPGGSRNCYDDKNFIEKLYRVCELLPCQFCGLSFLSANDRNDHMVKWHMSHAK